MSTFTKKIQKIITFLLLLIITNWLTVKLMFAFLKHYSDDEMLELLYNNKDTVFGSISFCSLLAFILTYVLVKFLNKHKQQKHISNLILYLLLYLVLFIGITCLL